MPPERDIQVLVVDDTAIYRKIVSGVVENLPGLSLLGTAPDGEIALRKMGMHTPDLVLLDVEMPKMDGLATLRHIRERHPQVGVVMVSGLSERHAELTVQALNAGALDFIPKPQTRSMEESRRELTSALQRLLGTFRTRRNLRRRDPVARGPSRARREAAARKAPPRPIRRALVPRRLSVLCVGVSTGGPSALTSVIPKLTPDLRLPVLVVQHMPPGFTRSLANQLDRRSSVEVREAEHGDAVLPGRVLIAPGGRHMVAERVDGMLRVVLHDEPPVKAVRPSADVLFRSLVDLARSPVLSLVMTGMGDDGADGVTDLVGRGAYSIAQDEESCVVYGMPRAIVERGLAHEVLHLEEIAPRINELAKRASNEA